MTMPKTTVYKNSNFEFCNDNIWTAGQEFVIYSVSKPKRVKRLAQQQFNLGVF